MTSRIGHFFVGILTVLTGIGCRLDGVQQKNGSGLYNTHAQLVFDQKEIPDNQGLDDSQVTQNNNQKLDGSQVTHNNNQELADNQTAQHISGVAKKNVSKKNIFKKRAAKKKYPVKREVPHYVSSLFYDALELHKNLVTWDTFKIAAMVFPVFVSTRMIDESLQSCFYDESCHKNVYYIPKSCHALAQWSISVPIVLLGSQAFLSKSQEMRDTSRVFLLGLPFVFWTKTLVKKMQFEANMRPWHEDFDCNQRSGGGFPSGHMAEATYTALLYGLSFGYRYAIPLGAVATFIGVSFVACNRHYISQIVAGAGLGAIYGVAAYKLANSKINEQTKLGFKINNGGPALSVSYDF